MTAVSVRGIGKKYALTAPGVSGAGVPLRSEREGGLDRRLLGGLEPGGRSREEFWALQDVSFEADRGEVVGIIGRNGAGKSTLLKILSRVTEPTTGTATLRGRAGSLLEVGTGFHPELSGRENVFLNGAILGMRRREIAGKFDEIVAFAEVEKFIDMPVKHYSSGMYMRLAFSVAAHLDPEIMIVDEVLAVGDAEFQKKCMGRMEQASRQGKTILFVSHNMGSISALCGRCLLLVNGRVEYCGPTQKAIAAYNHLGSQRQNVKIEPAMRNRGDGSIEFLECSLFDSRGEPKNSFLIGEEIAVEILLRSRFRGPMSFWLIVFDSSGRPLLSTHQRDRGLVEIEEGVYRLRYATVHLGLMPGSYSVTAGAFDTRLNFLEWIDGCQSFEVYPCFKNGVAFDSRWGAVDQAAEWRLVPEVPGHGG